MQCYMITVKKMLVSGIFGIGVFCSSCVVAQKKITTWLTDPGKSIYFKKQATEIPFLKKDSNGLATIHIYDTARYQSIDGFGFTLTGGSAINILKLPEDKRKLLLQDLFGTDASHIGTSYLRLSIGASDLSDHVFSYLDLPDGDKDEEMKKFDLGPDKKNVIPVLKMILQINPKIKIIASPWSPPVWMKNNNDFKGGGLMPVFYTAYARYLVKYIRSMAAYGISIHAITVQNEPLNAGNNPSLYMPAEEQAFFVKNFLGPAFEKANIKTKIIIYDHNADKPEYPISILKDEFTSKYVDGSAFHLYGGDISALSVVHDSFPNKNIYFTEQWIGGPGDYAKDIAWHIRNVIIGSMRNWSKTALEWNLASDDQYMPHTDKGGCTRCLGAITVSKGNAFRNPAYFIIAHAAKFVRPGSVRIGSDMPDDFPNVAFKTPDGKMILIVLNTSTSIRTFNINLHGSQANLVLGPGAVATYVW